MDVIPTGLLELPSETKNASQVKDIIIDRLYRDGIIDKTQANIYSDKWQIILIKKSWFQRWKDIFKSDEDGWHYRFVKLEN